MTTFFLFLYLFSGGGYWYNKHFVRIFAAQWVGNLRKARFENFTLWLLLFNLYWYIGYVSQIIYVSKTNVVSLIPTSLYESQKYTIQKLHPPTKNGR